MHRRVQNYLCQNCANKDIAIPENTLNVHDRIVTRYESSVGLDSTNLQF